MVALAEELFSLKGRVAFVSGASSGLGLHLAGTLARAGASVVLAARRVDKVSAAAAELTAQGHRAHAVALDVTRSETIPAAFDAAEEACGKPVDVLLNNAGIVYASKFLQQEEAEVSRILDTNFKGAFLVAQETARRMAKIKQGSIINVASTAGLRAAGMMSSYAAAKAGLIHLTKIMALELAGRGIRVNVICPGNFETDMHDLFVSSGMDKTVLERIPQRRFGKPQDLDGVTLLLASDAGRYMTGAVIAVDGGQSLSWM
ncbi:MAG: glucose 1-dehydrogenase [Betaproteobacteria bacterium]|nr:glucose 1-dehydrogenase [Betaproteobacteria bacterium]